MKRPLILLLLLGSFLPLAAGVEAQVDWVSRYVWRGFDLTTNRSCVQPQVTFGLGNSGFSLNLWASFCLMDRSLTKNLDEVDATLIYSFPTGEAVSLEAGLIVYAFYAAPDFTFRDNTSPEVYVKGGLLKLPLAPSLALYYDLNLGKGFYAQLSAGHTLKLGEKTGLDLSGSLGYNAKMYIDDSGFSDLAFSAALPVTLGKVTLTPYAKYSISLLDSVNEQNEFWFGASIQF